MLRVCSICAKGTVAGKVLSRKGMLKKYGGTGSKVARSNARAFLPNLQKKRILIKGHPKQVYLCAKCIKKGRFTIA